MEINPHISSHKPVIYTCLHHCETSLFHQAKAPLGYLNQLVI